MLPNRVTGGKPREQVTQTETPAVRSGGVEDHREQQLCLGTPGRPAMRPEGGHSMQDLTGQGEPSGFIQSVWGSRHVRAHPAAI